MKKLLLASALIAFGGIAAPAMADHHMDKKHHKGEGLKQADTNEDGVISKAEFLAHSQEKAENWFAKIDTDGDGVITKEEGEAGREKMHEKMKERREKHKEMREEKGEATE